MDRHALVEPKNIIDKKFLARRNASLVTVYRVYSAAAVEEQTGLVAFTGRTRVVLSGPGQRMRRLWKSEFNWRRLTASVLIYALVLHGAVLALAGVGPGDPSDLASDPGWAGVQLCHHDGAGSPNVPASPADNPHCIFCLAGASFVLSGPPVAPSLRTIAFASVAYPLVVWRLPADTVDANARPRGPPLA